MKVATLVIDSAEASHFQACVIGQHGNNVIFKNIIWLLLSTPMLRTGCAQIASYSFSILLFVMFFCICLMLTKEGKGAEPIVVSERNLM